MQISLKYGDGDPEFMWDFDTKSKKPKWEKNNPFSQYKIAATGLPIPGLKTVFVKRWLKRPATAHDLLSWLRCNQGIGSRPSPSTIRSTPKVLGISEFEGDYYYVFECVESVTTFDEFLIRSKTKFTKSFSTISSTWFSQTFSSRLADFFEDVSQQGYYYPDFCFKNTLLEGNNNKPKVWFIDLDSALLFSVVQNAGYVLKQAPACDVSHSWFPLWLELGCAKIENGGGNSGRPMAHALNPTMLMTVILATARLRALGETVEPGYALPPSNVLGQIICFIQLLWPSFRRRREEAIQDARRLLSDAPIQHQDPKARFRPLFQYMSNSKVPATAVQSYYSLQQPIDEVEGLRKSWLSLCDAVVTGNFQWRQLRVFAEEIHKPKHPVPSDPKKKFKYIALPCLAAALIFSLLFPLNLPIERRFAVTTTAPPSAPAHMFAKIPATTRSFKQRTVADWLLKMGWRDDQELKSLPNSTNVRR